MIKSLLVIKAFLSTLIFFTSHAVGEVNSKVYFSCDTKKGNVKLEVKGNKIIYSISKDGINDFSFSSKGNDFSGFLYNSYSRYQTEYITISFNNGVYTYSVFSNYEDGMTSSGVTVVNNRNSKETKFECNSVHINDMYDLTSFLMCDKNNALGCG
ncbi:hypothetical protein [Xenorhabdus szentirmaii]|uniref:hypothetical protein n=1 Tax=Xenorhabdus szentirmaii TaxID=290112 RepID=UPI00199FBE40|nr:MULTISPECIES: hypothetical protein [unclassified Xenorhabdus]MBD2792410.1 hypothetical protein [Xenorhabdus sp. CUL]MBD2825911.1 hypothetical protein [Xenorhabdus sp. 5]